MDLFSKKNIYFLGIGGIGMSALARYFHRKGFCVAGYDRTSTPLTAQLESEGISIHYSEDTGAIPEPFLAISETLVVYTPAVPATHAEMQYFREKGYDIRKRSEVLGILANRGRLMAVAGTHGKTTTSTILTHIFCSAGKRTSAFLGGISLNYGTNFLLSDDLSSENPVVVEADEYDRSFLTLHPSVAIVTSVDADHLDIYHHHDELKRSFEEFAGQVKENGALVSKKGLAFFPELKQEVKHYRYSLSEQADFFALSVAIREGKFVFDLHVPGAVWKDLVFSYPGRHNLENAIAASAAAWCAGIGEPELREALATFKGVHRRFERIAEKNGRLYIDDYAHHPEELRACINSVKELFPGKKVLGIFQPHLFSRTRDFAEGFSMSLGLLDDCLLMDIYPARELPIPGVDSAMLLRGMNGKGAVVRREDLLKILDQKDFDVLITLGAGDIDQMVEPIKKWMEAKPW